MKRMIVLPILLAAISAFASTDAGDQAAARGINYFWLSRLAQRDDNSLRRFMSLGARDIFDGAGSEQYSWDLQKALEKLGEKRFLAVLNSVSANVRKEVLGNLSYEAGHEGDWNSPQWEDYTFRFPILAPLIFASTLAQTK